MIVFCNCANNKMGSCWGNVNTAEIMRTAAARTPDGGTIIVGEEDKVTDSFSPAALDTEVTLSRTPDVDQTFTVTVDGTEKTLTTHYSVDADTKVVTFVDAFAGTEAVVVTFYSVRQVKDEHFELVTPTICPGYIPVSESPYAGDAQGPVKINQHGEHTAV
jgi:hypothetical protein